MTGVILTTFDEWVEGDPRDRCQSIGSDRGSNVSRIMGKTTSAGNIADIHYRGLRVVSSAGWLVALFLALVRWWFAIPQASIETEGSLTPNKGSCSVIARHR